MKKIHSPSRITADMKRKRQRQEARGRVFAYWLKGKAVYEDNLPALLSDALYTVMNLAKQMTEDYYTQAGMALRFMSGRAGVYLTQQEARYLMASAFQSMAIREPMPTARKKQVKKGVKA